MVGYSSKLNAPLTCKRTAYGVAEGCSGGTVLCSAANAAFTCVLGGGGWMGFHGTSIATSFTYTKLFRPGWKSRVPLTVRVVAAAVPEPGLMLLMLGTSMNTD